MINWIRAGFLLGIMAMIDIGMGVLLWYFQSVNSEKVHLLTQITIGCVIITLMIYVGMIAWW